MAPLRRRRRHAGRPDVRAALLPDVNYLAHLALAERTPESLIGNLGGDFVKGPLGHRFDEQVARGIAEHRKIDEFTDTHPSVAAFRRVLIPDHGHYARVIADVFFDHFLAADFERHVGEPLDAFLRSAFGAMDSRPDLLPDRLRDVYPHMRRGGWLESYADIEGIRAALRGISRRLSRAPELHTSVGHLVTSREELAAHFETFFPDVQAFARSLRET